MTPDPDVITSLRESSNGVPADPAISLAAQTPADAAGPAYTSGNPAAALFALRAPALSCQRCLAAQLIIRWSYRLHDQAGQRNPLRDRQLGDQDPAGCRLDHLSPGWWRHETHLFGLARQQVVSKRVRPLAVAQPPLADAAYADFQGSPWWCHQLCRNLDGACSFMRSARHPEQEIGYLAAGGGKLDAGAVEARDAHARSASLRIDDQLRRSSSRIAAYCDAVYYPQPSLAERFTQPVCNRDLMWWAH